MSLKQNKVLPSWLIHKLPDFEKAEYIPQLFSDSTHELWRLQSRQGNHFLKVCSNTDSPFWQIKQQLFGVDLRQDIEYFENLYRHISALTPLQIPELIKAESVKSQGAFILTSEVNGSLPEASRITQKMVMQLANHIANLHKDKHSNWGVIHKPLLNEKEWQQRLRDTLEKSAQPRHSRDNVGAQRRRPEGRLKKGNKWGGVKTNHNKYLAAALDACDSINPTQFVPFMSDLRWDQFIISNNSEMNLLDLDAFVLAPRELDFVLLEYLLNQEQAEYFIEVYSKNHDIPDLRYARHVYRLLFFFMEVLGEKDIDKWMNVEHRF